ncbi:DNA-binding MarR family transcriptional regulator [Mycobacterium sp. MAA66]|uniref:MarR family winged helix-turn-helix transcriptional regulator n=1 Tax=Mycobacterium sp. MAA66 TaxID=3156297 RepID=UPI0035141F58
MTKTTKPPRAAQLSDSAMHQLRRASQALSMVWQRHLAELTPPQFAVLYVLAEHDELDQSALGALTSIDRSTLTPLLDRLEARKLIGKTIDPTNRRRRQITITATGRQQLSRARAQVAKTELWIDEVLGEKKAGELVALLRAFADASPGLGISDLSEVGRSSQRVSNRKSAVTPENALTV